MTDPPWKRRLIAPVEKYILNPQVRFAVRRGLAPSNFALLETTGRRSGRWRQTPVGNGLEGDTFWLVAEHGESSDYVQNLMAEPQVRVKAGGEWRSGVAVAMPDDDGLTRRQQLDRAHGLSGRLDGLMFRAAATQPLTIRIDLDPTNDSGSCSGQTNGSN
ncbi:MAG: nitroreductase/quinone reductase family protein [Nocardioidaceae bacterium]